MQTEEYEKALAAYIRCSELDDNDALTISYLGEAYERLERYEEALDCYLQAREINPEIAEPWLGTGIILELQGEVNQAINFLKQAVQLQPENSNYRLVLGEAYYKSDRLSEAEIELERALHLEPDYSEAVILLAKIKIEYSLEEALEFILSLENLSDYTTDVRMLLIAIFWQTGQKTEALLLFKKEYLIDKGSAKTLFLYLPEAKLIPDFLKIIDLDNEQ